MKIFDKVKLLFKKQEITPKTSNSPAIKVERNCKKCGKSIKVFVGKYHPDKNHKCQKCKASKIP